MKSSLSKATVSACVALFLCACGGGGAELSPELTAHLETYENLIDEFEPKFESVKNDPHEFSKVANAYSQQAQAWMSEWQNVAPNLSDEEGRAVKAIINKLNQRAKRMLTGV